MYFYHLTVKCGTQNCFQITCIYHIKKSTNGRVSINKKRNEKDLFNSKYIQCFLRISLINLDYLFYSLMSNLNEGKYAITECKQTNKHRYTWEDTDDSRY